jgi:ATP-dependent exoDNAse (exonuclease V) beta subunit
MLSEQLDVAGLQASQFTLQRNYRTDPRLLEQLEERYFAPWKAPNKDWLPADPPPLGAEENRDREWLDSGLLTTKNVNLAPDHPAFLDECARAVLDFLSDPRISTCKVSEIETPNEGIKYAIVNPETVTILTRTNRQAEEIQIAIQKLVKERQDQLRPVRELSWLNDIEAGLFEEENAIAARSLLALLRWLASPHEVESNFNLMATGWTHRYVDWRVAENLLLSERDDHRQTLQGILQTVRSEFKEAQVRSQSMPTPALLAWAVDFYRIAERANELTVPEDAFRRQQFLGNLRLVIAHLVTDSSDQQWSVAGCIDWLEMKLATEASSSSKTPAWRPVTEEQPAGWSTIAPTEVELSKIPLRVQAMTAHKAKGLEFKHVVLPCLHHGIFVGSDGLFAPEQGSSQPRWQFKIESPKRGKVLSAPNIEKAELKEVMKEEARLLYVALTRAKKTILLVHGTCSDDERSWANPFLLNQP